MNHEQKVFHEFEPQRPLIRMQLLFGSHDGKTNAALGIANLGRQARALYLPDAKNIFFMEAYGMNTKRSKLYQERMNSSGALDGMTSAMLYESSTREPTEKEIQVLKVRLKTFPDYAWRYEELVLIDELRKSHIPISIYLESIPEQQMKEIHANTNRARKAFRQTIDRLGARDWNIVLKLYKSYLIRDGRSHNAREEVIAQQINGIINSALEKGDNLRLLGRFGTDHFPLIDKVTPDIVSEYISVEHGFDHDNRYMGNRTKLEWALRDGYIPTTDELVLALFSSMINQVSNDWAANTERTDYEINNAQQEIETRFTPKDIIDLIEHATADNTVGMQIHRLLEEASI